MIKKAYAKLALFIALGTGLISPESAKASNNIAQCFSNNVKYEILAHYQIEQADYYLVDVFSLTTEFLRNVIKVDNTGNCSTVVGQKEITTPFGLKSKVKSQKSKVIYSARKWYEASP